MYVCKGVAAFMNRVQIYILSYKESEPRRPQSTLPCRKNLSSYIPDTPPPLLLWYKASKLCVRFWWILFIRHV